MGIDERLPKSGLDKRSSKLEPERRSSERIPFRSKIKYGLYSPTSEGYSFDLSEMGIGITASKLFPRGSLIVVKVVIEDETEEFVGRVVWSSKTTPIDACIMGIQFVTSTNKLNLIYQQKIKEHKDTSK